MAYRFTHTPSHSNLISGVGSFSSSPNWNDNDYVSISCWVRTLGAVTNNAGIVWLMNENGSDGQYNWYILYMISSSGNNVLKWTTYSNGTAYTLGTFSWSQSNYDWHFIMATANKADQKLNLLLDDGTVQSKTSSKSPTTAPNGAYISGPGIFYNGFNGDIAEVAIYNVDILYYGINAAPDLYKGVSPLNTVFYKNVIAYWDLNGWTGERRNGRTLTAVNNPTIADHCRIFY